MYIFISSILVTKEYNEFGIGLGQVGKKAVSFQVDLPASCVWYLCWNTLLNLEGKMIADEPQYRFLGENLLVIGCILERLRARSVSMV